MKGLLGLCNALAQSGIGLALGAVRGILCPVSTGVRSMNKESTTDEIMTQLLSRIDALAQTRLSAHIRT